MVHRLHHERKEVLHWSQHQDNSLEPSTGERGISNRMGKNRVTWLRGLLRQVRSFVTQQLLLVSKRYSEPCRSELLCLPSSHITKQTQYEHPCAPHYRHYVTQGSILDVGLQQSHRQPAPRHTDFHQPNVLVPASPYLHEGMLALDIRVSVRFFIHTLLYYVILFVLL